jgi:hypothetical protein
MKFNTLIARHEARAKLLSEQATKAMREWDWDRAQELDRAADRERELATIARAERFRIKAARPT